MRISLALFISSLLFLFTTTVRGCDQVCVMACLRESEFVSETVVIDECVAQCDCGPPTYPGRCLSSNPIVSLQDCVVEDDAQEWLLRTTTTTKTIDVNESMFWLVQSKSCLTVLLQNRSLFMNTSCSENELWSWVSSDMNESSSSSDSKSSSGQEGYLRHNASGMCLVVNATVTGSDKQAGFSAGGQVRVFPCNFSSSAFSFSAALGDPNYAIDADVRSEWVMSGELNMSASFVLKLGGGAVQFGGQKTQCTGEVCLPPSNLAAYPSWMYAHRLMARLELQMALANGPQPETDVYDNLPQVASTWVGTQMMVYDRFFYDNNQYSVARYLADLRARFGGIDQVLIWPTYPNIGVDNRGTWDMFMSLPGGLEGVQKMIQEFQQAGVLVLLPYHPFDAGTSWRAKEINENMSDARQMALLVNLTGADGFNGDTNRGIPYSFLVEGEKILKQHQQTTTTIAATFATTTIAATSATTTTATTTTATTTTATTTTATSGTKQQPKKPMILEPEQGLAGGLSGFQYDAMSWSYGFQNLSLNDLRVSRVKLVEPRHMGHICDRWSQDQTVAILNAFFNGLGFVAWENVWGMWNELTPRSGELLRRVSAIQRHFSRVLHLRNDSFWPFFNAFPSQTQGPDNKQLSSLDSVRVTRFYSKNETLFVVVMGPKVDANTWPLVVDNHVIGSRYFDVYHGDELTGRVVGMCLTAGQLEASMQTCGGSGTSGAGPEAQRADQRWNFENGTLRSGELCLVWDGLRLYLGSCSYDGWTVNGTEIRTTEGLCLLVDPSERGRGHGAVVAVGACGNTDGRSQWSFTNSTIVSSLFASSSIWLSFAVEPLGVGAVYVLPPGHTLLPEDASFFVSMRNMTYRSLSDYSTQWGGNLPQTLLAQKDNGTYDSAIEGMVKIDESKKCGGGKWEFSVSGLELEGEDKFGVDIQYPWEKAATRAHTHTFSLLSLSSSSSSSSSSSLSPFYIDKNLVTNKDFLQFLNLSGYVPQEKENFLKHWGGEEEKHIPVGFDLAPVVWISRKDAESYCAFHGKRLPEDWEWQFAAQGCDKRIYPWGNATPVEGTHIPPLFLGRQDYNASVIGSFPMGVSASGVYDLIGNVWQWTSLFEDTHTRGSILRGGSVFRPGVGGAGDPPSSQYDVNYMWFGDWYFPGGTDNIQGPQPWGLHKYPEAYQLQYHAKYLMMSPALDRSGAIGFRCAASVTPPTEPSPSHWIWILVPSGVLLAFCVCIGCLFHHRGKKRRVVPAHNTPSLKQDVNLPSGDSGTSYRSLAGYDADVSADASNASGSHEGFK